MILYVLLCICLLWSCDKLPNNSDNAASLIQPANSNASESTRKLLSYLYDLPNQKTNRLISGHLAGGSIGPRIPVNQRGSYDFSLDEITYLHSISGQWVGLIGADYCVGWMETSDPVGDTMYYGVLNKGLIDWWNAGGLVCITTHQFDPRELHKDGGQCFFESLPAGMDKITLSRVYTPGTEEYTNFRQIMDIWAAGFQELEDHGVVVLWRPFNEARDGKWWCLQPVDQYVALYRYTFNYLTHDKGLNNLLWVFDDRGDHALNLTYYPGDDYVDVVGYTMNWDEGAVREPTNPKPNKVFACVEFNVRSDLPPNAIQRDYDYMKKFTWVRDHIPYASYFMSWDRKSGPYGRGIPESVSKMYSDPVTANRGEINWQKY